jgi:hypothetical protein
MKNSDSAIILKLAEDDQKVRRSETSTATEIEKFDAKSTKILKDFLSKNGWPIISKYGKEVSHAAWLLAQHSRDNLFLRMCLDFMEANKGDVDKQNLAYLTDRVLLIETGKQRYGCIVTTIQENGEWVTKPMPLENEEIVENLRRDMGMETLGTQIDRCHNLFVNFLSKKMG